MSICFGVAVGAVFGVDDGIGISIGTGVGEGEGGIGISIGIGVCVGDGFGVDDGIGISIGIFTPAGFAAGLTNTVFTDGFAIALGFGLETVFTFGFTFEARLGFGLGFAFGMLIPGIFCAAAADPFIASPNSKAAMVKNKIRRWILISPPQPSSCLKPR